MSVAKTGRLIFIGRFQPLHRGHLAILEAALQRADRVSVIIGSARQPRSVRNPFSETERRQMFERALPAEVLERIDFGAVEDVYYCDPVWCGAVRDAVRAHGSEEAALIGHDKDASSWYLRSFPQWPLIAVPSQGEVNGTALREGLLAAGARGARAFLATLTDELPKAVAAWLADFAATAEYGALCEEYAAVHAYRSAYAQTPWPAQFVTADVLLEHRGAVLLVRRGGHPGRGLLALPGGFVDAQERIMTAAHRELAEEAGIRLEGLPVTLAGREVYDHPLRSARGRFFTHVYHYRLDPAAERPEPRAGDDAAAAGWHAIDTLDPRQMFEDHYPVIQHCLGRYAAMAAALAP